MTNFIIIVSTVLGGAWEMFQLKVPGFDFSFAHVIIAVSFASTSLFLVRHFFSDGTVSVGRSTRNPKISEERKNDTR